MAPRLELQALLQSVIGPDAAVYFQPPASLQMTYPCIVYALDRRNTIFADDKPYNIRKRYQVTVIDRNPDSVIPDEIAKLPMCTFDRRFPAEQLNHDVFNIFF